MERRLAAGFVEGAPQNLAINGDNALAGRRKLAHELLKAGAKRFRIEQTEHAGKRVVARQSIFEFQELPKKLFLLPREQRHVPCILPAAKHSAERNNYDLHQVMSASVAGAGVRYY